MKIKAMKVMAMLLALMMIVGFAIAEEYDEELQPVVVQEEAENEEEAAAELEAFELSFDDAESEENEEVKEAAGEASEEPVVEAVSEEQPEDEPSEAYPVANALTYNGEAQALVKARGAWLYSMDGENYSEDIPTAVDAGEYTVYYKAAEDAEPETLAVTVAKADVTFTPPVAAFIEE